MPAILITVFDWVWKFFASKFGKILVSYTILTLIIDGTMLYVLKYLQPFLNMFGEAWHLVGGDTAFFIWITAIKLKMILKYSAVFVK